MGVGKGKASDEGGSFFARKKGCGLAGLGAEEEKDEGEEGE